MKQKIPFKHLILLSILLAASLTTATGRQISLRLLKQSDLFNR